MKFDFILHWLWALVFSILALSGIAMAGAKYGWVMQYDIATADVVHRVAAIVYVLLTLIVILYEIIRILRRDKTIKPWLVFGPSGYGLFTFITTLIFIITGAFIWLFMDSDKAGTALSLWIHEKLTYLAVASVIWHIYMKTHALMWPKKKMQKAK
ncbi:cytochrome b/b6 domain-containing protein [Paenibacillus pedocola]|uniref:cytochrome b/b6 domain-containing protein n=1 Tax=Paenibacillus pedocola TaxID=3242193 RepID=UPI002877CA25|nr:cytochrome b/b6 domain-containing protein [Paenibacillus typhae]